MIFCMLGGANSEAQCCFANHDQLTSPADVMAQQRHTYWPPAVGALLRSLAAVPYSGTYSAHIRVEYPLTLKTFPPKTKQQNQLRRKMQMMPPVPPFDSARTDVLQMLSVFHLDLSFATPRLTLGHSTILQWQRPRKLLWRGIGSFASPEISSVQDADLLVECRSGVVLLEIFVPCPSAAYRLHH